MRRARSLTLAALLLASPALAEDGLGGFFSHLFGGPPQPTPSPTQSSPSPRPSEAAAPRKRKKPNPVAARERDYAAPSAAPSSSPTPPVAPATPPPSANQFVYVLGDSLAISAADGMAQDLQSRPEIGVIDRARDASGLVRDDYFDWAKAARDLVAPGKDGKPAKVDFVFVMLGINDLQPLRDGKDYVDILSDRWKAVYAQRIQAVVAPLQAAHAPVAWVGLPPMRNDKVNAEIVALNQLFKENAEKAGATYFDIFDAFADQSGGFDAFGPNMEGQKVKLRGPDGIHFTAAGGQKLARFLEPEALAALKPDSLPKTNFAALPPDVSKAADDINEQIRREATPKALFGAPAPAVAPAALAPPPEPEAGAIVSLASRPASPGATLVEARTAQQSEAERRLRRGDPPPARPGRADDFTR
jgi:hypothetical protein